MSGIVNVARIASVIRNGGDGTKKGTQQLKSGVILGTLNGPNVNIDGFSVPIPFSEFEHCDVPPSTTIPTYDDGDRLVILLANDGNQYIIVGRLL